MQNENGLTLRECLSIALKRKWLTLCIAAVITIISAVFLYTQPTTYKAAIPAEISSARTYFVSGFGNDFIINSPPTERIFPAHLWLLKSRQVLERTTKSFKARNAKSELVPKDLSRMLKVTPLNSKRGTFTLEAQGSTPESAVQLVNIWAQEYKRYNEELSLFCVENISLAHNETQLIEYDKRLKELVSTQEAQERLLHEIKSKLKKNWDQQGFQDGLTAILIALNELSAQTSSLQELRQQLYEEIDRQKIKLDQLRTEIDLPLLEVISFANDENSDEQNKAYKRALLVADESLPGFFSFSSLAEKAQAPLLSKVSILAGLAFLAGLFAVLLACLPEIYRLLIRR